MKFLFCGGCFALLSVMFMHGHSLLFSKSKGPFNDVWTPVAYFSKYRSSGGVKASSFQQQQSGNNRLSGSSCIGSLKGEYRQNGDIAGGKDQMNTRSVIQRMFADRNVCDRAMFDTFIKDRLEECDFISIAQLFRLSGRKSRSKSSDLLKKHLPSIASRLQTLSSVKWRAKDFSFVIYGLQCLEEDDAGYVEVLSIMTGIANKTVWDPKNINSQLVTMMLCGLQKNRCAMPESRLFLAELTQIIYKCTESLDAQAVGTALYGIQRLSSDSAEVRALISALVPKVKSCTESLSAQAVGNALFGLRFLFSLESAVSIIEFIAASLDDILRNTELFSDLDLQCLGKGVALCLPTLRTFMSVDNLLLWDRANTVVSDELSRRKNGTTSLSHQKDRTNSALKSALDPRQRIYTVLSKSFDESHACDSWMNQYQYATVVLSHGELLFDLYRTDVVTRIPYITGEQSQLIVNIEVYNKDAQLNEKMQQSKARLYENLKSLGVYMSRIERSLLKDMSDKDIVEWTLNTIAQAKKASTGSG